MDTSVLVTKDSNNILGGHNQREREFKVFSDCDADVGEKSLT